MNTVQINPLFVKEVRTLFRGKGFLIILNSYLGLVALILIAGAIMALGKYYTTNAWEMGRSIVLGLGIYQLIAFSLIAPALTAATMSLERDRDTYDVLMVMPLGLPRIVFYKTLAALMLLVMLVMVSLPLLAGGFVLGGVAPEELFAVAILTLLAIISCGALGLMFSSLFHRTIIAVPGACLTAIILMVVSAFWIYVNNITMTIRCANPIIMLVEYMQGAQVGCFGVELPMWLPTLVFLGLTCLLFLAIATEGFRFRFRRNYAMVGIMLLLLFAAVLFFTFGEMLNAMPETLGKSEVFRLVFHLLLFSLFMAALDPVSRKKNLITVNITPKRSHRVLTALFRPGLGLTLSTLVVLGGIWIGVAAFYPALHEKRELIFAPSLLAATTVMFYSALARFIANVRNWKRNYVHRILTGVFFICIIGFPHVTSMILHASDNQATSQSLDVLLFLSPYLACLSLGGDVLSPYPYLEQLLQGINLSWATITLYGILLVPLSAFDFILSRRQQVG